MIAISLVQLFEYDSAGIDVSRKLNVQIDPIVIHVTDSVDKESCIEPRICLSEDVNRLTAQHRRSLVLLPKASRG